MLYGSINQRQLYYDYPEWKIVENDYIPSSKIIKELSNYKTPFFVEIFLGTWCSDSEREVPAFFKIINLSGIKDNLNVKMWAVDKKKALSNGLAKKRNIEFVPTFIFYKSEDEIGRIVEMPEGLLEEDILGILSNVSE
jgi:hypothetical protein